MDNTQNGLIVICSNFSIDSVLKGIQQSKNKSKKALSIVVYKPDGVFTLETNDNPLIKAVEEDLQGVTTSLTSILKQMETQLENSKAAANKKMETEDNLDN